MSCAKRIILPIILLSALCSSACSEKFNQADLEKDMEYAEYTDADSYFENNGDVLEVISAADSADTFTELSAITEFGHRGFIEQITSDYSINGEYETAELDPEEAVTAKHPVYTSFYVANTGITWLIMVNNGQFMASPLIYSEDPGQSNYIVLSETPEITSYDAATNKFYISIPDTHEITVKQVDHINAETLDTLDTGTILAME